MNNNMEKLQKNHFDSIAHEYYRHYGDDWSQSYRDTFINSQLIDGLDIKGKIVLDAMCGSGETTKYLLEMGARVTGIDISQEEIKVFQQNWPQCDAYSASILKTDLKSDHYDCVVVVGGLHHVHPYSVEAVEEIHRILKKGGYFCFMDPHKGSVPDMIRKIWYRYDRYFEKNESAIDLDALKRIYADRFKFVQEKYKGNIAYLLVLNSLIFRVPLKLKKYYSPLLLKLESVFEKIQGEKLSCFAVCQWEKK